MSYWSVANGPGRDVAKGGKQGQLLDALIAAKIPAAEAQRIVAALSSEYAARADMAGLVRDAMKGRSENGTATVGDAGGRKRVEEKERQDSRSGGPVLQVDGRVFVTNNMNVGGDIAVNNLRVFNNALIGRGLAAGDGVFRSLAVPQAAQIGPGAFFVDAPLVANSPLVVRQGGQYAGQNTFDGQVQLNGQVVWAGRACNPAVVTLTKSVVADGTDKLTVGTQEVRVLNDHGDGDLDKIQFAYTPDTQSVVQSVTTEAITVITGAGFDAENCAVTTSSTQIFRVVSISAATVAGATGQITITGGLT